MFNSKKKKPVLENVKTRFVIPQIEDSLAGLKTSRGSFKKSEFASSLLKKNTTFATGSSPINLS